MSNRTLSRFMRYQYRRRDAFAASSFACSDRMAAAASCSSDIRVRYKHGHSHAEKSWAPPAYRSQESMTKRTSHKKKFSARRKNNRGRSSSGNNRAASRGSKKTSRRKPKEKPSSIEQAESGDRNFAFIQSFKLQTMHHHLLYLLNQYQTLLDKEEEVKQDGDMKRDMSDDEDDMDELWHQVKDILDRLKSLENTLETKEIAQEVSVQTQQTHSEIARLMRNLIQEWTKQPPGIKLYKLQEINTVNQQEKQQQQEKDEDEAVVFVGLDDNDDNKSQQESVEEQLASHDVAERLLLAFLRLQTDRTRIESSSLTIQEEEKKPPQQEQTWTDWFRNIFVFSPGQDEESNTEQQDESVVDQEYRTNRPSQHLCHDVLKCIVDGYNFDTADSTIDTDAIDQDNFTWKKLNLQRFQQDEPRTSQQELAQRLESLINEMTLHNVKARYYSWDMVLKAYAQVGLLESAKRAEYLHKQLINAPVKLFHSVLKAYRLASTLDPNAVNRTKAAKRPVYLMHQRYNHNLNQGANHFTTIISHKLVLQTLANPGIHAIPDMCDRAEGLVKRCCTRHDFLELITKDEPVLSIKPDLGLLHYLTVIYATSTDSDKIERAKRLLRYMEKNKDSHKKRSRPPKESKKHFDEREAEDVSFPNVWSYNAVLAGLLRQNRSRSLDEDQCLQNAIYGMEMVANAASPDKETFQILVKLWATTASPQAGDQAEKLLSRVETQSAYSDWVVDHSIYSSALKCWTKAAAAGQPGAAQRAMLLFEKMRAQCSPVSNRLASPNGTATAASDHFLSLNGIYNDHLRPDLYDCNSVISACARTCHDADSITALEIAFDVFNSMIEQGVRPSSGTFALLLSCCVHHLKDDPERRTELARRVFQSAADQDMVNKNALKYLRLANADLHSAYKKGQNLENTTEVEEKDDVEPDSDNEETPELSPSVGSADMENEDLLELDHNLEMEDLDENEDSDDLDIEQDSESEEEALLSSSNFVKLADDGLLKPDVDLDVEDSEGEEVVLLTSSNFVKLANEGLLQPDAELEESDDAGDTDVSDLNEK